MVHGLVQAPPVPGAARPQRAPGRADHVHRGRPHRRLQPGSEFNVNGIDATKNGKTLVFVQSNSGKLFTAGANGVARAIALAGGESVANGDGILLDGKTLYVVQNSMDVVAKIALSSNLRSGRVVRRISDTANLDFPTTIAELGSRLYAVNARFDFPSPDASTPYWVTKLPK